MSSIPSPDERLRALGAQPLLTSSGGLVRGWQRSESLLYTSGQIARDGSEPIATGKLGREVSLELGRACARQTAINTLLAAQGALGSLDAIRRVLKLTVFIASAVDFTDQPQVANAASEVFLSVLGDAGAHARSAIGVAVLPLDTPVELEAVFEVWPARSA